MSEIRIRFGEDIQPDDAMSLVSRVVAEGRMSISAGREHYCWATRFHSAFHNLDLMVVTSQKRSDHSADCFEVYWTARAEERSKS